MKKIGITSFIIVLLLIINIQVMNAKGLGKVESKTKKMKEEENIVLVGDSIFDWYPTDKIFSDLPVVNSGIAGNTTPEILKDMENRIYKYNPTKVFILIGTNDLNTEDSKEINEEVFNNIVKIVEGIKTNREKSEIYVLSIFPVNTDLPGTGERYIWEIKDVNSKLQEYCSKKDGVEYIDLFSQLANEEEMFDEEYTDDGLHPNDLGYAKITEVLMKYIYN